MNRLFNSYMKYIRIILFIIFSFLGLITQGQIIGTNLIRNYSFEDYDTCPINTSELYKANFWWGYSADYYNSCSSSMGVPFSLSGFQVAYNGNAYAGIIIYENYLIILENKRETIKTKLIDSLVAKKRYCTNLFLSLAETSYSNNFNIHLDSIGMLFTANQVQDSNLPICNNCAQVNKSISTLDTINWLRISGNFIANGGEKYLIIGNFQQTIHWPIGAVGMIYTYIDDVSVCECAYTINLGMDTSLCEGESLLLNATLPNASYLWQDGSNNATYSVKQPGTYWVMAYVAEYDITSSDTIVISAEDENVCNTPAIRIPNSFTPNGDGLNDKFAYFYTEYYDIRTFIYNRWGQLIFEGENTDFWDGTFKGKIVPLGVYAYKIETMDKRSKGKKVHSGRVTVVQ